MSNKENNVGAGGDDDDDFHVIIDSRNLSYQKYFIIDILNADISFYDKYKVVKINDLYVSKVSISGLVVGFYEQVKFFRVKIDDSTAKINITIWKDQLYQDVNETLSVTNNTTIKLNSKNTEHNNSNNFTLNDDIYELEIDKQIKLIRNRIKEKTTNTQIMYKPEQGDFITVNGYLKCYKNIVEMSAITCNRVNKSIQELINVILPIKCYEKCYQLNVPTRDLYDKCIKRKYFSTINNNNSSNCNNLKQDVAKYDENLLKIIYDKLVYLTNKSYKETGERLSCPSFSLYLFIRDNYSEYKMINLKLIIDGLKELELRSMVYSCEDDNHYLPA